MRAKRIEGSTCWAVEHAGQELRLCPCCCEPFRTRLAAEAVRELLAGDAQGWADCLRVQGEARLAMERAGIR